MTSQTRFYGSNAKTTLFGYDTKGNRTSVTDFTGASTVYTFDSVDRVKTATMPSGTVAITYWPDGLPKSAKYTAGSTTVTQARCYDDAARLKSLVSAVGTMNDDCTMPVGSNTLRRFDYQYDANGNRTRQDEMLGTSPATVSEYGLDELDRLVASVEGNDAKLYALDAVGNRTGEKATTASAARALGLTAAAFLALAPADTLASVQASFNRADWLTARTQLVPVTGGGTTAYTTDANGNLLLEDGPAGAREYKWDARNTLTVALLNSSEVGRYDYDFERQRVKRTAGGQAVEYVLDGDFVLNELDASQVSRPSTRRYHYGSTKALAVADASGARWMLNDGLGSVSDEVLLTGSLLRQRQYDAWGGYRNGTAPNMSEPLAGYTGHLFDPETKKNYMRGRYQDPALGIFLSRDIAEGDPNDAPSLHRYTYARDNPLFYWDPSGWDEVVIPEGGIDPAQREALLKQLQQNVNEKTFEEIQEYDDDQLTDAYEKYVVGDEFSGETRSATTAFLHENREGLFAKAKRKLSESKAAEIVHEVGAKLEEARDAAGELVGNQTREVFTEIHPFQPGASNPIYREGATESRGRATDIGKGAGELGGKAVFDATVSKGVGKVIEVGGAIAVGGLKKATNAALSKKGQSFAQKAVASGEAGEYAKVGGHHVHSKAGFRGAANYNPDAGFSISQDFIKAKGWSHEKMSAAQRRLFDDLSTSGRPNTLAEHTRIAVEALQAGGATEKEARSLVAQSLNELRKAGVTAPTRIPWN